MPTTPTTTYEPYEWTDTENTPIFAEDLNHMEEGIFNAHSMIGKTDNTIEGIIKRLSDLEAVASTETRFSWAPEDKKQGLYFYRTGNVVFVNCRLVTYFTKINDTYNDLIPVGYRPLNNTRTHLTLLSSGNFIGNAIVQYNTDGSVSFTASTATMAEYMHTISWITEDAFPHGDVNAGQQVSNN